MHIICMKILLECVRGILLYSDNMRFYSYMPDNKNALSAEEVRTIQLSMLDEFIDYCNSHSLKYSMGGALY